MLNYIWGGMILLGIIVSFFTGKIFDVTQSILNSAREAIDLSIVIIGMVAAWSGLMKIGEEGGIMEELTKKIEPILTFLFPSIPKNHSVFKYIATNIIANILGLGYAATPAGLLAMKELQALNSEKEIASEAMCMFMIINMSSIQLISVNIIAYRTQYGSVNPTDIVFPTLIVTIISTLCGVFYAKSFEKKKHSHFLSKKFCRQ